MTRSSTAGEAWPRPHGWPAGWDDDDPGTDRKSIAHARPAIQWCRAGAARNQRCRDHRSGSTRDRRCRNHQRRARHGLASTGGRPDGMTMIREPPANPLRTRDPRSNGVGLARRATNDVGITGLDRPRPAVSESSTEDEAGLAPTGGRTGWDDDDPGTARIFIAHARRAIRWCRAGATRNQRCRDHRFGSTHDRRCRNHQRRARHGLAPTCAPTWMDAAGPDGMWRIAEPPRVTGGSI